MVKTVVGVRLKLLLWLEAGELPGIVMRERSKIAMMGKNWINGARAMGTRSGGGG